MSESAGKALDLPFAMNANAMQGDREICLDAGMNNDISKPVEPGILSPHHQYSILI